MLIIMREPSQIVCWESEGGEGARRGLIYFFMAQDIQKQRVIMDEEHILTHFDVVLGQVVSFVCLSFL
ncbi:hypothetical protein KSP40_PGU002252 [Platanthera guangdongensis]|uniref:Uncharacterized protein n=1 Tax=Platanthera guangdongensis TaxID=2320717 RepID=A0ABR2N298_9ASPA